MRLLKKIFQVDNMLGKIKINKLKEIPIELVLSNHGIQPKKTSNNSAWYLAFDREENTASIKVDFGLNRFYDHGIGKGGSVIDVVMLIEKCSLNKAITFLEDYDGLQSKPYTKSIELKKVQSHSISIFKVQSIIHPGLIEYLESRCIDFRIAEKYCQQVHYKVNANNYFGIGFINDEGGHEIRSKFFKGGNSPKTITTILNGSKELLIFEGFFDFLSYLTFKPEKQNQYDFIVLNSVSNHAKINDKILNKYDLIYLFLDNDKAGRVTTTIIQKERVNVFDYSNKYIKYKDLNEYLLSTHFDDT